MEKKNLSQYFDHTCLKSDAIEVDIQKLCADARNLKFHSVCVNGSYVSLASALLAESDVKVCTVVGFPLGAATTEEKVMSTDVLCKKGATEIDMVINIGALKDKKYKLVEKDIQEVVNEAKNHHAIVKVILETCLLTEEEIVKACELAESAGADFVKTSTGFSKGGATKKVVRLMKKTVGERVKIKAAGGIKTLKDAEDMLKAGADRLGSSASVEIIKEQ